jgi:hypothetical protein
MRWSVAAVGPIPTPTLISQLGDTLLLLLVDGVEAANAAEVAVILEASADDRGEVVADFECGRKAKALMDIRTVEGTLERGVEGEVPAAKSLVDDRPNLPGPCVGRIDGALIANFGRDADADGPVPTIGHANAGADMVANPLDAVAVLPTGEDVEAYLGPVVDAFGELEGFVLLMIGGDDAVDVVFLADGGEVGMELDHEGFGCDGVGTVDLDLVIALRVRDHGKESEGQQGEEFTHSETPS